MRLLTIAALAIPVLTAQEGYVDPQRCRPCHTALFDSYKETGMGQSFGIAAAVPALAEFFHTASNRRYSVEERNGAHYLRRFLPETADAIERRIDYVIGSGNHSKTFVHRDSRGRLLELPLSWYSERGGYWAMSPGYDRPDHSEFRREVSENCLFCHNGYPPGLSKGLAMGIDCQRCHGPGQQHVESKGKILNPSQLTRERQLDVCLQCHMESASRTLPDAVRRIGRDVYSYTPWEPLANYKLYFEFAANPRDNLSGITVNSSAYTLMKSACFQKSASMTCTTCHDPHLARRGKEAAAHYTQVCRSCHAQAHEASRTDCATCHMQKRRTEDAVHVVMTDHSIHRRPLMGDMLAPIAERHDRQSGPVKRLYPSRMTDTFDTRLAEAMAQVRVSNNLREDIARLQRAIRAARPRSPEPYRDLAAALSKAGRTEEAIAAYREALRYNSKDSDTYVVISDLLLSRNNVKDALALLEPATQQFPESLGIWNSLSVLYARNNRMVDALQAASRALQIDPEDPLSWLNLGVCLQAKGDKKGAETAYRQALLLQPDLSRAKDYLKLLLEDKF